VSFVGQTFAPVSNGSGDAGTGATLVRTDANTTTRGIQLFGVNTNGSVDGQLQIALPTSAAALVDPIDASSPGTTFSPLSSHQFTGYSSQASFRGGNGPVAMSTLADGDLLAAALVSATDIGGAVPASEDNYIAVARVDSATSAVSWVVAAHTGDSQGAAGGLSKAILGDFGVDGIPGTGDAGEGDGVVDATPIGRIARASESLGFLGSGPSISPPAMDRAGNLYFAAEVRLNGAFAPEYTQALLRANRDSATGGYRLELLLKAGDVIAGQNSALNYQVQFLGVFDTDSIDSGTIWSGNIVNDSFPWATAGAAPAGSPFSLGAMVLRAKIVYDVDANGQYADASISSNSPDQGYNVLLALMPRVRPADFNRDGQVSVQDIFDFLSTWSGGDADYNGADGTTVQDIFDFLSAWSLAE
jgi:hypothetical protein